MGDKALAHDDQQLKPVTTKQKISKTALAFGLFNLLIALGLATVGYYFVQQSQSQQKDKLGSFTEQLKNKNSQISSLTSRLDTQNKTLENLNTELTTQDSEFERGISKQAGQAKTNLKQLAAKLEQQHVEMKRSILMVKRQLSQTRGDFLIADAEYLLSIANQRIQLAGDVKTSMEALEAADQRLRESGDSGVFKVREAIAKELSLLKRVPTRNTTDLFLRLNPLIEKIPGIPLLFPSQNRLSIAAQTAQAKRDKQAQESTSSSLDTITQEIKSWVSISRTDRPLDVILTPAEVSLIHHTLRLNLETAKLALVNRNEGIYTSALNASITYLAEHFNPKANETQIFRKTLESLRNTPFSVKLPDIGRSLKLLRDISKFRIESDKANSPHAMKPPAIGLNNQPKGL